MQESLKNQGIMRSIGKASKHSGVTIETIRYYEREKIVPEAERHSNGSRLYDNAAIARLRFIRRCRDLGFPIIDIRAFLDLSSTTTQSCSEVRGLGERYLTDIRARIMSLQEIESALVNLIQACDDEQADCPALKALFAK